MHEAKIITDTCLGRFRREESAIRRRTDETIEQYRKGTVTIRLTDRAGRPLPACRITLRQTAHHFRYGANLFMLDQYETAEENAAFRALFAQYFNLATIPFYWDGIEPEQGKPRYASDSPNLFRRPAPDLCLDYCRAAGIEGKLHCLFYDKFTPAWLPKDDVPAMRALYEKRFAEIAARYAGRLYEFEVINELLSHHREDSALSDERDVLDWSFALAARYFPGEKLVLNDGNFIPAIGRPHYGFRHPYCLMVEGALARGVPIGKLGVQNHIYFGIDKPFLESLPAYRDYFDPALIIRGLDTLSAFGLPLEITESLIPTPGEGAWAEEVQAELFRYLYTIWFGTPQMESILYWNTVEGSAYASPGWDENRCGGFIFRRDFTPKPAALVLRRLFEEEWRTNGETVTDEGGTAAFRGFYGRYEATVHGQTFPVSLLPGNDHTITLTLA